MRAAIIDAFSGIAGDMTLGALIHLGLSPEWLCALPAELGLDGVAVRIADVQRGGIACKKVDFDIPPQPHGRHIHHIRDIVGRSAAPAAVKDRANEVFTAIATVEGEIHGIAPEKVHLHEVGAVDAILDVVGSIWGMDLLGVERVYCGTVSLGDGFVKAAHGVIPVPAPATLRLLEGHLVRPGPENAGELVTPTGAGLVKVLSSGPPPGLYTPVRSGYGAGTKEFKDRPNALRIVLADVAAGAAVDQLVVLACDIDDMPGEYVAAVAERLRESGARDVVLTPTIMKRGRPGVRVEVLADPGQASTLEAMLLTHSTTIGVRRSFVERRALPRESCTVEVLGHQISVKIVILPDGSMRAKPEFSDVLRASLATGKPAQDIFGLASSAAERRQPTPGS